MRLTLTLVIAVLCMLPALPGSAAAADPWNLHCATMPTETRVPSAVQPAARKFFPWVGRAAAEGLHSGPVYLLALSFRTSISRDGDERDAATYYEHRALIAIAPSYGGRVSVVGSRLGSPARRTTLGFSTDGASHCTLAAPVVNCHHRDLHFARVLRIAGSPGWRVIETELRIGRTGCFVITATGRNLRASIPLAVPGPDWGTPGW